MHTTTYPRIAGHGRHAASSLEALNRFVAWARQRVIGWRHAAGRAGGAAAESIATLQANRVRALARRYVHHDPHFAADLFAAADRHEEVWRAPGRTPG
jgi:hypothetical protein